MLMRSTGHASRLGYPLACREALRLGSRTRRRHDDRLARLDPLGLPRDYVRRQPDIAAPRHRRDVLQEGLARRNHAAGWRRGRGEGGGAAGEARPDALGCVGPGWERRARDGTCVGGVWRRRDPAVGDVHRIRHGWAAQCPRVRGRYVSFNVRFGCSVCVLSVRALGETDLNPVSGLGKISQLFFAWIQPGNVVANIIAGGVAEAGAQQ